MGSTASGAKLLERRVIGSITIPIRKKLYGGYHRWRTVVDSSDDEPRISQRIIDQAPEETREKLREMRACLREVAPDAEESLKWSTPAF